MRSDGPERADDGTGATYTGHATAWGNVNLNEKNQNSEFTFAVHATGSDGTSITAHETTVFVLNANGTGTVNFDNFSLACGLLTRVRRRGASGPSRMRLDALPPGNPGAERPGPRQGAGGGTRSSRGGRRGACGGSSPAGRPRRRTSCGQPTSTPTANPRLSSEEKEPFARDGMKCQNSRLEYY